MRWNVGQSLCALLLLGGCAVQLSPPQLVGNESSDVAVQEFMYAGQALAYVYGFEVDLDRIAPTITRPTVEAFGVSARESVSYRFGNLRFRQDALLREKNRYDIREYFIKSGHHASQIVCRNYLSGLRDRNEHFEYLQKQLKVATNLTGVLMALTNTAGQTKDIYNAVVGSTELGMDAYQGFRFLNPDIETVLPLVQGAQVAMRDYFLSKDGVPATFAGALNAVSKIEYQCTRSGIRAILTKTLVQAQPKYTVIDGTLYAHKAEEKPPVDEKGAEQTKKKKAAAAKGASSVKGQ